MRKVLVTGARGFIGRHCLSPLAARGYDIHAVSSREETAYFDKGVSWHRANLQDLDQCATLIETVGPTHLLHLAWFAKPGEYWDSVENLRWVQSSLGLLQLFLRNGGRRVVMAGTCAEYDWRFGYCSEKITPLAPSTLYGICKHSLQCILMAVARQAGLSAAWGRIFFVYGPHEHPSRLVPSVMRALLRGEIARCSHGNQIRDYLFVEDLADAFVGLLDSQVVGPVNLASGRPIPVKEIVEAVASLIGRPELVEFGALPSRCAEPDLVVADVRRLAGEVGWRPVHSLQTGLERTLSWWRTHLESTGLAGET